MMRFKDLTGTRFGRLLVLGRTANNKHGHPMWDCLCACGGSPIVAGGNLTTGNSTSCGCQRNDTLRSQRRLRPYEAVYRQLLCNANHRVELTYEEFLEFTKCNKCHYCDVPLEWTRYGTKPGEKSMAHRLDRKDNARVYTLDNCVPCCERCNIGKSRFFTYDEWKQIGQLIRTWKK